MSAYIIDWLNLLLRWGHLITGIAWIGSSFYFVWLDNSLEEPSQDNQQKGFGGQLSSIHAGGFYEVGKYKLAPQVLPDNLHWFKWEAYSTWLTGFFLLVLMFYVGAEVYLIDAAKMPLSVPQAIGVSLATLVGGWLVYDTLCRSPLAKNTVLLASVLLVLITALSWGLHQLISDRAAYLHIGALMGTCMAANVFFVIMPGQRALVAAVAAGEVPDMKYAIASKVRSVHNNYVTLPVLFLMISNHYPMTYGHEFGWLVLIAILLIGALTRHFFNLRHKGEVKPMILVTAAIATAVLAWVIMPKLPVAVVGSQVISDEAAYAIVQSRCLACHAQNNTDDIFTMAQGGVMLDTLEQLKRWAPRVLARSVTSQDMPFMNKTGMLEEERQQLGQWIVSLEK